VASLCGSVKAEVCVHETIERYCRVVSGRVGRPCGAGKPAETVQTERDTTRTYNTLAVL